MQQDIIIVNHMFSGKYLEDNIGHEIINLYKSDSGEYFIYLCKNGTFDPKKYPIDKIKHVLLVRRTDKHNELEVLGVTTGKIEYIAPNDPRQWSVLYGGKPVGNIFKQNLVQQDLNLTFKVENVVRPTTPILITKKDFGYKKDDNPKIRTMNSSQTLRTYIKSEDINNKDYDTLSKIIDRILQFGHHKDIDRIQPQTQPIHHTAMEIYGIVNWELSYSNALKYFLDLYGNYFASFFGPLVTSKVVTPGKYIRSFREWEYMDLIVEYENAVFIIENKIFSKINGKKKDPKGELTDQLIDYYNKIKKNEEEFKLRKITHSFLDDKKERYFILLTPDHNNIVLPKDEIYDKWIQVKYSQLKIFLQNLKGNIRSDSYLDDFYQSVSYHSETDYNYAVMRKRFLEAIEKSQTNIKLVRTYQQLVGKAGLFKLLKSNYAFNKHKVIMMVFDSNKTIDLINERINKDFEILKINLNPELINLSSEISEAKLIVYHKYIGQLDLEDLEKAVELQTKHDKNVVYFINSYSLPQMTDNAKEYIQEHFLQCECYIDSVEGSN